MADPERNDDQSDRGPFTSPTRRAVRAPGGSYSPTPRSDGAEPSKRFRYPPYSGDGLLWMKLHNATISLAVRVFEGTPVAFYLTAAEAWSCGFTCKLWWSEVHSHRVLRHFFPQGFPDALRPYLWKVLLLGDTTYEAFDYEVLSSTPSANDADIKRDVGRTFPDVDVFKEKQGAGQQALFRLLRAGCTALGEEIGYCQGMNFVAGHLLLVYDLKEHCAFQCFMALMIKLEMKEFFKPRFPQLQVAVSQFDRLVKGHLTDVHHCFLQYHISANYYATVWFMALFAYGDLPAAIVHLIWDGFFLYGWKWIFRVGLALLALAKAELLHLPFDELLKGLKTFPKRLSLNKCSLFEAARSFKVTRRLLATLEVHPHHWPLFGRDTMTGGKVVWTLIDDGGGESTGAAGEGGETHQGERHNSLRHLIPTDMNASSEAPRHRTAKGGRRRKARPPSSLLHSSTAPINTKRADHESPDEDSSPPPSAVPCSQSVPNVRQRTSTEGSSPLLYAPSIDDDTLTSVISETDSSPGGAARQTEDDATMRGSGNDADKGVFLFFPWARGKSSATAGKSTSSLANASPSCDETNSAVGPPAEAAAADASQSAADERMTDGPAESTEVACPLAIQDDESDKDRESEDTFQPFQRADPSMPALPWRSPSLPIASFDRHTHKHKTTRRFTPTANGYPAADDSAPSPEKIAFPPPLSSKPSVRRSSSGEQQWPPSAPAPFRTSLTDKPAANKGVYRQGLSYWLFGSAPSRPANPPNNHVHSFPNVAERQQERGGDADGGAPQLLMDYLQQPPTFPPPPSPALRTHDDADKREVVRDRERRRVMVHRNTGAVIGKTTDANSASADRPVVSSPPAPYLLASSVSSRQLPPLPVNAAKTLSPSALGSPKLPTSESDDGSTMLSPSMPGVSDDVPMDCFVVRNRDTGETFPIWELLQSDKQVVDMDRIGR